MENKLGSLNMKTVQLYLIVENLVWNSITNPTRFTITTADTAEIETAGRTSDESRWSWSLDGGEEWDAIKFILNEGVTQSMLRTAVPRAKEILPALTHCFFFVCDVDETLVCINGINCSARHAFFAFVIVLTLTTSTSVLLYQVCMPSSRIACTRRHEVPCCTY